MNAIRRILVPFIGLVWLLNGIWAKLLHGVPRHEAIVARFLDANAASVLTPLIGIAEGILAIWWLSGYSRRLNASLQIIAIISMNTLEAIYASDLLLWGRWNAVWAALLCVAVSYAGLYAHPKRTAHVVVS